MKEQFCDYETAKMLKELGFWEKGQYYPFVFEVDGAEGEKSAAILWQQVEQWLWKNQVVHIYSESGNDGFGYEICQHNKILFFCPEGDNYPDPITAKTEGIKAAIKHLHSQLSKEK